MDEKHILTPSPRCALYLAPLRGVTDALFRLTFERYFGAFDFLLAPFIPTLKGVAVAPSHIRDVTAESNDRHRLIPQIIGNNPDQFLTLCEHLGLLGYHHINWNLGCPHTPITRKKRGSGLLPHPELVAAFLQQVIPRLPPTTQLSVKVRLGLEQKSDLGKIIPVLNAFPLAEVTIHPRTGAQQYRGSADLDAFEEYFGLIAHPVVYNGDIFSLDDFLRVQRRFPTVNKWMIGRGIITNPFLLASIKAGSIVTPDLSLFGAFHDELFAKNSELLQGQSHLLGKMKEFWGYAANLFPESGKLLKSIQRCVYVDRYIDIVKRATLL